jgi:hypothetical protein
LKALHGGTRIKILQLFIKSFIFFYYKTLIWVGFSESGTATITMNTSRLRY